MKLSLPCLALVLLMGKGGNGWTGTGWLSVGGCCGGMQEYERICPSLSTCEGNCGPGAVRRKKPCTGPQANVSCTECNGLDVTSCDSINVPTNGWKCVDGMCKADNGNNDNGQWNTGGFIDGICCNGIQIKYKECNNPYPSGTGENCKGNYEVANPCQTDDNSCPVCEYDCECTVGATCVADECIITDCTFDDECTALSECLKCDTGECLFDDANTNCCDPSANPTDCGECEACDENTYKCVPSDNGPSCCARDGDCRECGTCVDNICIDECQVGKVCNVDTCVECLTNCDCPNPAFPFCESHVCVGCRDNSDCGACGTCSTVSRPHCDPIPNCCIEDCDCSGQTPFCSCSNTCVACREDSHCGTCEKCALDGSCTPIADCDCVADCDCSGDTPVCSCDNTCVECSENKDCINHPSGPICSSSNECEECVGDHNCLGKCNKCDVTSNTCYTDTNTALCRLSSLVISKNCLFGWDCNRNEHCVNFQCRSN